MRTVLYVVAAVTLIGFGCAVIFGGAALMVAGSCSEAERAAELRQALGSPAEECT